MNETDRLSFVSTVGREFACAIGHPDISPQDGYEPIAEILGSDFGSNELASLNEDQISTITARYRSFLEIEGITEVQIAEAVRNILFHWPPN